MGISKALAMDENIEKELETSTYFISSDEDFISLETAILCKQKGINIPNTMEGYYPNGDEFVFIWSMKDGTTRDWKENFPRYKLHILQKYLREQHKMHIELEFYSDDKWSYWLVSDIFEEEEDDGIVYNTYEEALEKGLQESLKYIQDEL